MVLRGIDFDGLQVKEGEKFFFWVGKYYDNLNDCDIFDI